MQTFYVLNTLYDSQGNTYKKYLVFMAFSAKRFQTPALESGLDQSRFEKTPIIKMTFTLSN